MRGRLGALGVVVAAVVVALTSGCSFALVRGPEHPRPPSGEVKCTDSPAAPIGDALLSVIPGVPAGILFVIAASGADCGGASRGGGGGDGLSCSGTFAMMGAALLSIAATLVASSVYGFVQVARCNAAKEAARARARPAWLPAPVVEPRPP